MGTNNTDDVVDLSNADGLAFISQSTPLTRLHYFDGKFLRADAFTLEQDYHRTVIRLANLAGGWGAVNGLGVMLDPKDPGLLDISAGLAVTPAGDFVYATGDITVAISDLLAIATPAPIGGNASFAACPPASQAAVGKLDSGLGYYEITVGPVQGLCGNEAVYGKLCEAACVSDSQRPYWREGVVVRLRPITLQLPDGGNVAMTSVHLRNRVASAYFAAEPWLTRSSLSAAGLNRGPWCNPATLYGRDEVVIGLLVREANVVRVIDAWAGRRERMDTQARGYWQGVQAMRPWNVFTAQILQFQCQLSGLFDDTGTLLPTDNCNQLRELLGRTRKDLETLHRQYRQSTQKILQQLGERPLKKDAKSVADSVDNSYSRLYQISELLGKADIEGVVQPMDQFLVNAGFIELPPCGYLPITLDTTGVDAQMKRFFGDGVRLHYHAVRHDEIAHLVQEAQHMDRISLVRGLADPKQREDVEVFLPDGKVNTVLTPANATWWQLTEDADVAILSFFLVAAAASSAEESSAKLAPASQRALATIERRRAAVLQRQGIARDGAAQADSQFRDGEVSGLARTDSRPDGSYGYTSIASGNTTFPDESESPTLLTRSYLAFDIDGDPFALDTGDVVDISLYVHYSEVDPDKTFAATSSANGAMNIVAAQTLPGGLRQLAVSIGMEGSMTFYQNPPQSQGDPLVQVFPTALQLEFTLLRQSGPQGGSISVGSTDGDAGSVLTFLDKWTTMPQLDTFQWMTSPNGTDDPKASLLGLQAAPSPSSTLRKNAEQLIQDISGLAFDASFPIIAEQRLFDVSTVETGDTLVPSLDWVMFRRARTLLCCADVGSQLYSGDDVMQVWHLKLDSADELKALQAALDSNDADALAGYKFQAIGVLRYPDESADTLDTDQTLHDMWSQAQPAASVVLARVWEKDPGTGQGWQNHFRLFNMLKQIPDLTEAPADVGRGVIHAIKRAPAPFVDSTLDGGMLVVTAPKSTASPRVTPTRRRTAK